MLSSAIRRVLTNTLISALAFAAVGIIGLLLVPVIVGGYGLATYGLLMLARTLVPGGLLGVFDPGLSEQATGVVSRGRVTGDWAGASAACCGLLLIAGVIGLIVGVTLAATADPLAGVMRSGTDGAAFVRIVRVTGAAVVILFPALVLEGLIKGFEDFRALRTAEVSCTALYAVAVVALARAGASFEWIAYAFLVSLTVRALWLAAIGAKHARNRGLVPMRPNAEQLRAMWRYGRHLAAARLLSTLRDQGAAPAIGALLGPGAVGVYDVVARLPRFLKSTLALLNGTLLPLAARLHHGDDNQSLARMAGDGMALAAALAVPVCAVGAMLAEPLLRLWIGPELARYALWLALMFAVPAVNATLGMLSITLLPNADAVRGFNAVMLVQTLVFYGLGVAAVAPLQERAFFASAVAVAVLAFPAQVWIARRHLTLTLPALRPTLAIAAAGVAGVAVAALTPLAAAIRDPLTLAFASGALGAALFSCAYGMLPRTLRLRIWQVVLGRP